MKFKLSTSNLAFRAKPTSAQMGKISNSLIVDELNLEDIAKRIGSGKGFCSSIFKVMGSKYTRRKLHMDSIKLYFFRL